MLIKIDDLLGTYNIDRTKFFQKNPAYKADFDKLDAYTKQQQENPTDITAKAINDIVIAYFEKLKKENTDLFTVEVAPDSSAEIKINNGQDSKFIQQKKDFVFFLQEGNQDGIDDLFTYMDAASIKRLLIYDNFKTFVDVLRTKNSLIIYYIFDSAEKYGILPDAITGRDGIILNLVFATKDSSAIKRAVKAIKEKKNLKKEFYISDVLTKNLAMEQAIETADEDLVADMEVIYGVFGLAAEGISKPVADMTKDKQTLSKENEYKQIIADINSNHIAIDIPLVSKTGKKTSIRILETAEQISSKNSYRVVCYTNANDLFSDLTLLHSDGEYTIMEKQSTEFERKFGASVYEFGFCWYNILNLLSVDDLIAIMYLANISPALITDRYNPGLRKEYRDKLPQIIQNPDNNKISGRFFQMKESNMKSLQRSGFLDEEFCPTKMLYIALALHAFSFPAYTHPFEFINISSIGSVFQFKTLRGEYGNETFYTDGDSLYHNFVDTGVESSPATEDVSRSVILNLKSFGRTDLTKNISIVNHFIPLFYTVPKSNTNIPSFSIKMLDVQGRKINWGVYELKGENKVFVNSYALDNFLVNIRNNPDYRIFSYEGKLSNSIFSTPEEGIILQYEQKFVAVRGLNARSFLSENFGKNWERYYTEMFDKNILNVEILDNIDSDLVKSIYTSEPNMISSSEPNLMFKTLKKLEETFIEESIKPESVIVVKKPAADPIKEKEDKRVYISKSLSREQLNAELWPIYDRVVQLTGEERDEAILDEMTVRGIDRIFPDQLVLLGFDLPGWAVTTKRVKFKNKYQLRIPSLLSWTYYLEKL